MVFGSLFSFQLPLKQTNQPRVVVFGLTVPQSTVLVMCNDDDVELLRLTAHCDTLYLCLVPVSSHFTETIVVVFLF